MAKTITAHGSLRVLGALYLDEDATDFPPLKRGGLILKGSSLYGCCDLDGVTGWWPLIRNMSKTKLHQQITPSLEWNINTNFDTDIYWYIVKDQNGNQAIPANIIDVDSNNVKLVFLEAISGTAFFVAPTDIEVANITATNLVIGKVNITPNDITIDGKKVLVTGDIVGGGGGVSSWNDLTDKPTTKALLGVSDIASLNGSSTVDFSAKNLTVSGTLAVKGSVFKVDSQNVLTEDNIITLNDGEVGAGVTAGQSGIEVDRGTLVKAQLVFDESDGDWKAGTIGNLNVLAITSDITNAINAEVIARNSAISASDETTDTIRSKLGITVLSGSNTGDETTATVLSKLGISVINGSNTGDETATTIKSKLGISVIAGSNTGDETQSSVLSKLGISAISGSNSGDETQATILGKIGVATISGSNTGDETAVGIRSKLSITTLSGSNTGDETNSTILTKLGISVLSGSNTGDETLATIKSKLSITTLSGSNTGDQTSVTGNAGTATKLATARNIALTGDVVGTGSFDGSGDLSIATTLKGDTVQTLTLTGSISINYGNGSYIVGTVTGATTLTLTGVPDSTKAYGLTLELINAGTNITWPGSVTWLGTAPTLRASGTTVVTLVTRNGGTNWLGSAA